MRRRIIACILLNEKDRLFEYYLIVVFADSLISIIES